METIQPPDWSRGRGYAHATRAKGEIVFLAGQIGARPNENVTTDDIIEQISRTLTNITALLKEAGAGPKDIARMTWYLTDLEEFSAHSARIGEIYRKTFGAWYPAMSVVEVKRLLDPRARIEIECTAVLSGSARGAA